MHAEILERLGAGDAGCRLPLDHIGTSRQDDDAIVAALLQAGT